jgi:hypothetical protein
MTLILGLISNVYVCTYVYIYVHVYVHDQCIESGLHDSDFGASD